MRRTRRATLIATSLVTGAAACLTALGAVAPSPAQARDDTTLYLVTLVGPGTSGGNGFLPDTVRATGLRAVQDATLDGIDAPEPVYRWTTALNGYAVRLTSAQADTLRSDADVVAVEANAVRPLAGAVDAASGLRTPGPRQGGAGVVIGLIDTGIAPESPLFAQVRHDETAAGFDGECQTGQDWVAADCNGKVVAAHWYVDGFGTDGVSAAASLSARDTDGHGTQMASIAAGNAGVPVRVGGERLGRFGGTAPEAQLAVYKACWGAPDPTDDGCATADLVSAIDQATADGVDVLSLSVGGAGGYDTVERALLGAAEAGVVVTAAAGNTGATDRASYVSHPGPWVTTVGGTTGDALRGEVVLGHGRRLTGAMLSRRTVGPARVVLASRVAATGARVEDARVCTPGTLDAARVARAIVVCRRGKVGRVEKSRAVALADGAGMVLVNARRGSVDSDVHSVPTVHLDTASGRRLVRWAARHPGGRVTLHSLGVVRRAPRVAPYSPGGDPDGGVLKPDVLAPATGVLGAVPSSGADGWDFVTGTSAATAYTAGAAATLLSRRDWTAAGVRSALATTAAPLRGSSALSTGSGRLRPDLARSPGLAYLIRPSDYRAWLDGERATLNTPSALVTGDTRTFRRTVTNLGQRRLYFSSSVRGFRSTVRVRPAALRLGPGESATYRVTVRRRGSRVDDGWVVWRGATGTVTRIPVVLTR